MTHNLKGGFIPFVLVRYRVFLLIVKGNYQVYLIIVVDTKRILQL
jgi:hypothetical protein